MYVIKQPIPPTPVAVFTTQVFVNWNALYDAHNEVACLMLGSMTLELHRQIENNSPYEMLQELKSMFQKQARVERFDVIQTFHAYKKEEEKPVGAYVLKMQGYVEKLERLDRGGEYISQEFKDYLKACEIVQQLTLSYTPQHNGAYERRNRTLLDMVRSMMNLTTLLLSFCNYALESAAHILNMVPTKKVLLKRDTPNKLQQRSVKCIFIGYPKKTMGYYFYFPPENKIVVTSYLDEDIYMVQPEGLVDPNHSKKVCKVQRFIYGLKFKMDNSKRDIISMQERLDLNKTQGASTPEELKRMKNVPFSLTVGSIISTDVMVMAHHVQNISRSAFRSMLEREKLSGTNFNDWFRQLKLVLRVEKKMYVIKQPIPPTPAAVFTTQVFANWNALYDAHNEVACLMLESMTLELHRQIENNSPYEMLQELKFMFEKLARVERFDLIQTFHAYKKEEEKPVGAYVLKMQGYVEQLERLGYVLP
ncbi:zinc finger, CCHC-type containing protein [Tanacetum coccineum]